MEKSGGEIEIDEFLKFLKTSCHVNDLIRDSKESNSISIDFDELASNQIIKNLCGPNKESIGSENIIDTSTSLTMTTDIKSEKSLFDSRNDRKALSNSIACKQRSNLNGHNNAEPEQKSKIHPKLSEKLDYLINEGVLDSVLPFVCPVVTARNLYQGAQKEKNSKTKVIENSQVSAPTPAPIVLSKALASVNIDGGDGPNFEESKEQAPLSQTSVEECGITVVQKDSRMSRRKSSTSTRSNLSFDNKKQDVEVIIHVCDEIKGTFRDFTCPQKLLVSKMGYFTDVTAGQKLEDMDISVHCDIQIFEWLMKWIKKSHDQDDALPQLDATNVVPILVSASFLQMEPLLLDCLSFCHARLSDVVRSSTNLSCLNDSIITRLAAMFTNLELEMVKDKKERVTPRLWTKLIQSLSEPEPQALRGHYFSLAGLFRCSRCSKCLTQTMSSYISCVPSNIRLNRWGQLVSQHTRDTTWDLSNYVTSLFKELKSWRKVYWKLWGHCHFLYCCICESHFPVYQMTWCRFHPEGAQFLGPVTEGRVAGPAGRYQCCGQQAFRYETLPGPNGCQFREHSVLIENDRDRAILTLLQIASEGGNLFESPPAKLREEVSSNLMEPRWIGLCLMPTKCRPGLLPILSIEENNTKLSRRLRLGVSHFAESSSETDTSNTPERSKQFAPRYFSTSSDGCESESSSLKRVCRRRTKRQPELSGRYWSGELSARSNQDHQREFEEKIMKQVTAAVGKKTGSDNNTNQGSFTNCGTYIRLEAEWKDQLKQKHTNKQKFK
ncbi:SANT and BTB domain regulator of class switch recombination [Eupeodes corollae]|uniref:SANT and BTB domain regulator of class switch recombination n=1 Tax=Eupeodes corollae TaxID=290404 RepID=UPI0024902794|nr:SANT and BTB domain regulator of class switch recombination [Eupeodes corollae]